MNSANQKKNNKAKPSAKLAQLSLKPPTQRTDLNPRAFLVSQSQYLASIFDPLANDGCKIPDLITVPSATAQCVQRIQVTVNAGGVAGVTMCFGRTSGADYFTTSGTATSGAPAWNASASKSYGAGIAANCQSKRLVSAAVYYEYQGAPLNRKGRAILDFGSASTIFTYPPTASVSSDLLTHPYASDLNVADVPHGMVRYVPQDNNSFGYNAPTNTYAFGWAVIFIDGATAGDIVEFTFCENYEFQPLSQQLNLITPSPSISDPLEMSVAANAVSSIPEFPILQPPRDPLTQTLGPGALGISSAKGKMPVKIHSPSESSHTGREPTFFERFLGGVKKVLPGVKKALAFGMDLASLLGPLL